jgi:hypothetical protein
MYNPIRFDQNSSTELTIFLVFIKICVCFITHKIGNDWDALHVPNFIIWIKSSIFLKFYFDLNNLT